MISVIVPAYNERLTIPIILKRIKDIPLDKEIIVVDGGSTDGTKQYLEDLNDPVIRIVSHSKNLGKGAAVRTGFKYANGEIVIIQDADLEYHPQDYPELIKPILDGRADVVYGSRFIGMHRVFLFSHYVGNKILNFVANLLYNTNLSDMMAGYRVFRLDVVKNLKLKADGFGIEAELTAEIFKHGLRVYETPISYSGRSYEEGKKIRWYHFFVALFWLIRQKFVVYNSALDILLKMGCLYNYNRWLFRSISPYIGGRVLEIGAGIGNITKYLLRHCRELVVTDMSSENVAYLNSRLGEYPHLKIIKNDITDTPKEVFKNYKFDTLVCLNVLEHIPDDKKALENMRDIMQEDSRLIISVPAFPFLYGSLDKSLSHIRRYTKKELTDLLKAEGFIVENIYYFNPIGAIGWFINSRILKKKSFSKIQLWWFDKFLFLSKLIKLPFGISLIAICKKNKVII